MTLSLEIPLRDEQLPPAQTPRTVQINTPHPDHQDAHVLEAIRQIWPEASHMQPDPQTPKIRVISADGETLFLGNPVFQSETP